MHQHPRRRLQMRNELIRHKGGEGQIDQREGIDNRQQQPAAIFRRDDGHYRADHQADQRADVKDAQVLHAAVAGNDA